MKLPLLLVTIAVIYLSQGVGGSKILGVFWTPSKSHHILGSALLQALAKKGHNVTLLSPFIDDVDIPNFKQIKLTGIEGSFSSVTNPKSTFIDKVSTFLSSIETTSEKFWKNKPIQDLIESREQYDVIISLNFLNDGLLALNHHLGAPTIIFFPAASSSAINKYVANPNLPYYEDPFMMDVGSSNSFLARTLTTSVVCLFSLTERYIMAPRQERPMLSYLPNSPPVSELKKNVSLVMVNAHTSLESARPYVPNMVQIGGFYAQTTKKLPDNLQKYLDSAKDGAILFSFGTNMKIAEVEKDKLDAIMEGLRKIAPIKVLFKSEIDLKDAPKNVLVSKWLPQNDILAHPNIKAFITHGGLGGNTEAVYHGVPMIGIPLFADQKTNIENAVKSGYAVRIFYEDINQKTVDEALEQILKNPSYTEKAKKRSSLLRKQPMNPMDKAIWWVEHIIEHKGGEHLRNLGMDLEWYQLYMVDIMLFYLVVIVIMLTTSILSMRWIIRKLFFKNKNKTKNKKSKKE
ncbi:UDP-glycosyltransferase UGT5-like isoform X4 [Harmonia axyridis]|uniref:UDP-glycosyltransferase UGT5-like isoform X4 n=1 Tax=Harmonia axyridis TaxID=115357 RepID=UPI001E275CD5|nr:UDP-glycosyltransferase UGT5-like isoform X4 [Harmonia axyridis]XP_045469136.1 UDP-glycosyltransferase UGT5-like isoform X4 [Harmonia axyridis]XP_045469144.1 UDP-glycosyltransferase UGT5-like isoform X4 [Harmonia axyridis]